MISIVLKKWAVKKEENGPVLTGNYEILMNNKQIACQDFNEGYHNNIKIKFSPELTGEITALESKIVKEIEGLVN